MNGSLFLDQRMVAVEDYEEFLLFLQHNPTMDLGIDYRTCLTDSSVLFRKKPYLSAKSYERYFPILNLTETQIEAYCKWRSYMVSLTKNHPAESICSFDF